LTGLEFSEEFVTTASYSDATKTGLHSYWYCWWPSAAVAELCSVVESAVDSNANSAAGASGQQACLATPSVGADWMVWSHLGL